MSTRDDKSVLITGASKGIGKACALRLDRMGFRVLAGYRSGRDAAALREQASARLLPVRLDVTSDADIAATVEIAGREVGDRGLWAVVNNAAIVVAGPLEILPLDEIRDQLEVNVLGVLRVTQSVLPLVRAARGRIVNISSVNGRLATPYGGPYAASKFALEALSDTLRVELRKWGIDVAVVQPGAIRTPIWDTARERAIRVAEALPDSARELYARVLDRLHDVRAPDRALPPGRVADAVAHALTARRPRSRYRVGMDARAGVRIAQWLPDRLIDRLLLGRRRRAGRDTDPNTRQEGNPDGD